jgi:signal peptidase I
MLPIGGRGQAFPTMSEDHKPHAPDDAPQPVAPDGHGVMPAHVEATPETASSAPERNVSAEAPVETSADVEPPAPVVSADTVSLEPQDDPAPVAPVPVTPVVAAAATAAVTADAKRPIWSDQGDAPFDDGDESLTLRDKPIKTKNIKGPKPVRPEPTAGSETLEIVKTIVFALLIAFVLRVLLFQPFTIPSASMEPNLYEGDYIIVSKWSYGYSKFSSGLPINLPVGEGRIFGSAPARGDIVVFKLPRDDRTDYIKRVIGLPGDQIQMIANKLYINGVAVQDVVIGESEAADVFGPRSVVRARETLPGGKSFNTQDFGPGGDLDDTGVYTVPAGYYFMMGDNRDNSIDSRVEQSAGVGFVPAQNLVGKAQIIAFSWEPGASLLNPVSWFTKIRPSRFFNVLH